MGLIDRMPKLLCIQPSACAPIVKAFDERTAVTRWENPQPTAAVPIAVPLPLEGEEVLEALEASDGSAICVDDEEIFNVQKLLAREEGIFASPAGVSALAGAIKARGQGVIREKESVLAVVTGSGLKDLNKVVLPKQIPTFSPEYEIIKAFLFQIKFKIGRRTNI